MFEFLAMLILGFGYGIEKRQRYEENREFDYQNERNSLLNDWLVWKDHKGHTWLNGSKRQEVLVITTSTGNNQTEQIAYKRF